MIGRVYRNRVSPTKQESESATKGEQGINAVSFRYDEGTLVWGGPPYSTINIRLNDLWESENHYPHEWLEPYDRWRGTVAGCICEGMSEWNTIVSLCECKYNTKRACVIVACERRVGRIIGDLVWYGRTLRCMSYERVSLGQYPEWRGLWAQYL